MNFVITGISGMRNRGVEALLTTAIAGLRQRWPACGIHVLTYDWAFDSQRGYPASFHANPFRASSSSSLKALAQSLGLWRLVAMARAARLISGASAVIASGGDVFSSYYGGLHRHLMPLNLAVRLRVPVFFLGHSIGRFRTQDDADHWLSCARRSLGVTVRESSSLQYVVEELGLRAVPVLQTADTAFLLEPASPERGQTSWRQYGLDDSRSTVACSVSQGITRFAAQDEDQHIQAWTRLIDHIARDQGRQVLIIPHVQERYVENDDRVLATRLMQRLRHRPNVFGALGDHSAAEYKRLVSRCVFAVAERMHVAIAGFSSGVPTLTVGYSIKAEGIVADVYGKDTQGVLVPFPRFIEPGQTAALFDEAWARRDELARRLNDHLPGVKHAAQRNFETLAELLPSR